MNIREVSKKYGLTPDTLRYYEKVGLIKDVPRGINGHRDYDASTCEQIEFIKCMRNAGVEIDALLKYFSLLEEGSSTLWQRKQLLQEQKVKLEDKQQKISESIEHLNHKLKLYEEIIQGKREDFVDK